MFGRGLKASESEWVSKREREHYIFIDRKTFSWIYIGIIIVYGKTLVLNGIMVKVETPFSKNFTATKGSNNKKYKYNNIPKTPPSNFSGLTIFLLFLLEQKKNKEI